MVRQDADVSVHRLGDDVGDLARPDDPVGRDHLDLHGVSHLHKENSPFFLEFVPRFSTSSILPTLKKACSAMWSTSPLRWRAELLALVDREHHLADVVILQPILQCLQRFVPRPAQRNLPQHFGEFLGERMVLAVFHHGRLQTFLKAAAGFHRERDQVDRERQAASGCGPAGASLGRGPSCGTSTPYTITTAMPEHDGDVAPAGEPQNQETTRRRPRRLRSISWPGIPPAARAVSRG